MTQRGSQKKDGVKEIEFITLRGKQKTVFKYYVQL